jgi:hypothetical protein
MKKASIALFALGVLAVWIGFLKAESPVLQAGSQEKLNPAILKNDEQNAGVVIGHIKTRDRVVTIRRTKEGNRYTVKTLNGKTLDARINDKDFKARYPLLHDKLQTGLANNDATLRTDPKFRELDRIKNTR